MTGASIVSKLENFGSSWALVFNGGKGTPQSGSHFAEWWACAPLLTSGSSLFLQSLPKSLWALTVKRMDKLSGNCDAPVPLPTRPCPLLVDPDQFCFFLSNYLATCVRIAAVVTARSPFLTSFQVPRKVQQQCLKSKVPEKHFTRSSKELEALENEVLQGSLNMDCCSCRILCDQMKRGREEKRPCRPCLERYILGGGQESWWWGSTYEAVWPQGQFERAVLQWSIFIQGAFELKTPSVLI